MNEAVITQLAIYAPLLVGATLLGANIQRWIAFTHRRTQLVMSFVAGIMLGVAIFHLLPHAVYTLPAADGIDIVARWLMFGLLAMFLLLRVSHFHHHDSDDSQHDHAGTQPRGAAVALGLSLHASVDGVALAAAMHVDASLQAHGLLGFGVFLAILLHKPLDAMTITTMVKHDRPGAATPYPALIGFALICPVTALVLLWGVDSLLGIDGRLYVGAALAFAAGVFLCISLGDLLPEVHFHSHDKLEMSLVLVAGVSLAWLISGVESEHRHQPLDQTLGQHPAHEHEAGR